MVVGLTALIGLASSDGRVHYEKLAMAVLAMLLSQLAIGWTNDYVDREHDRVYQSQKPVSHGLVQAGWLPVASLLAVAVSFAVGVPLGVLSLALLMAGTAAGLAYNFVLKGTRLSWLPYVVAFAVLPPFVWTALDVFRDEFLWLYLVGTPLAVAVHIANVIPDMEHDTAGGKGGVGVWLGPRRAAFVVSGCLTLSFLLVALSMFFVQYEDELLLSLSRLGYFLLMMAVMLLYRRRPTRSAGVWAFRFVAIAGIWLTSGWLAAV